MEKNLKLLMISSCPYNFSWHLNKLLFLFGIVTLCIILQINKVNAQACQPIIQQTGSIDLCQPGSFVTLTAIGGISSYSWSTGALTSSITVFVAGTYSVTATYASGCTGTASIIVSNSNNYTILLNGIMNTCQPGINNYTITNIVAGVTYNWTAISSNLTIIGSSTGTTVAINVAGPGSFTITYNYGFCTKTETFYIQDCCTDYSPLSFNDVLTSTLIPFNNIGSNIYLNGVITVDGSFIIHNCGSIFMGPGAKIEVLPTCSLTVEFGSHIHGCDYMWKGIHVQSGGFLRIVDAAEIEDAEVAADLEKNTIFELGSTSALGTNLLQNNYIDVRFNGNYTSVGGISDVILDFTGFKVIYPGQQLIPSGLRPRSGFVLNNVNNSPVSTFGLIAGGLITINNHSCGFEMHNSTAVIFGTVFNDISNPNNSYGLFPSTQNGFAIYADAYNDRSLTFTGLGNSTTSPTTFINCRGGVSTLSITANVSRSIMDVTQYGIYSRLSQSPSALNYSNNTINVGPGSLQLFGIRTNFTGTSKVTISHNQVNVNANVLGKPSTCIFHSDVVGADNSLVSIVTNTLRLINQTQYGLRMNNIDGSTVSFNYIYCNQGLIASPNLHQCYSLNNCLNNLISENSVNSSLTSFFQANAIGYYNNITPRWKYTCNSAYQVGMGFQFNHDCTSPENFKGNFMQDNNYGLNINFATGAIGPQTHSGNQWSITPLATPFSGPDGAASVTGPLVGASQFIVHANPTGPINNYNPVLSSPGLFNVFSGAPFKCSLGPPEPPIDIIDITNGEVDNADTTDEGDNGDLGDYVQNRNLYGAIDNNVDMVDSSTIIQNYYDSVSLTAIGQLQQVANSYNKNQDELNEITNSFQFNDSAAIAISQQLAANYQLLNGGTLNSNDSVSLIAVNDALHTQLQNLITANDSLANAAKWYHQLNANTALNKNGLVTPNRLFEANQKIVHQIYLFHPALGNHDFTNTDSSTLYNIGHQCISYGGPAVIEARELYGLINPNENFDNVPCNLGNRWGMDNDETASTDLLVYPNPASDVLNIYLPTAKSKDGFSISIFDLLGSKVYSQKNINSKSIQLPTEGICNGMYFLNVISSDKSFNNTVKIQIVK
ncbi:MAG: T9SS type A sorting domain-containing protein [Bacteroidia bacterium]